MKWCRICLYNLFYLTFGYKWFLFHVRSPLSALFVSHGKWLAYLHFAIYATTTILQIQAIFGFYFKFINRYVKIVALNIVYYTKDEFI